MVAPWHDAPWTPRKWQAEALPLIQAAVRSGQRPVVHAVMGSGKSILVAEVAHLAAQRLGEGERVVIATPSQALVEQLAATVRRRCGDVGRYYANAKEARPVTVACNASLGALADEPGQVRVLILDEGHKSEAPEVLAAVERMAPRWVLGVTATPFRSAPSESLTLFDSLAYSYTLADALRDGVLVPWRTVTATHREDLDDACVRMVRDAQGPGIVSAYSIEDAEGFAEVLRAEGIPARAIHSRLPAGEREALVGMLQSGTLRALVHVALLAEGVDFPWLRWLCMRRAVSARVRFAQEVGRVLRCCPGKSHAVVYDPHDLFGRMGLATEAALGHLEDLLADDAPAEAEPEEPWPLLPLPPPDKPMRYATAVSAVGAWARRFLAVLEHAGLWSREAQWSNEAARWRRKPASGKQVAALGRMRWVRRHLPAEQRDSMDAVVARAHRLRAGVASDLMDGLIAVAGAAADARKARRHWPWPEVPLDWPALPVRCVGALEPEEG